TELVLTAVSRLLAVSDLAIDADEGRRRAERAMNDGSASAAFDRWIRAQGGDPDEARLPVAPVVRAVEAPRSGYVERVGAIQVGRAALHLGAGRAAVGDTIDHAVGVMVLRKRGDRVEPGEALAEIHAQDEASAETAAGEVLDAYSIGDEEPRKTPIVHELIS